MIVSSYDNPIVEELLTKLDDESDNAPARKLEERVKGMFKKATDAAYDDLLGLVQDYLLSNMADAIRDAVSRAANNVIESALAGDKETFGRLFSFSYNWTSFGAYFRPDSLPLGVELRRRLLALHHDEFRDKIVADMEGEVAAVRKWTNDEMKRLRERYDGMMADLRRHHAEQIGRMKARAIEADGCFEAAMVEGWADALASDDIDVIRDIYDRRVSHARPALQEIIGEGEPL